MTNPILPAVGYLNDHKGAVHKERVPPLIFQILEGKNCVSKIEAHSSMQGYRSSSYDQLTLVQKLKEKIDFVFVPSSTLLRTLKKILKTGLLQIDTTPIRISELKLMTLEEVLLYWVHLHDANFGHTYSRSDFLARLRQQVKDVAFMKKVEKHFFFEQRQPGIVTAAFVVDGCFCRPSTFALLQHVFLSLARQAYSSLETQNYLASDRFRRFLIQYCAEHYETLTEKVIEEHGRFQLPHFQGEGIGAFYKAISFFPQECILEAASPLAFVQTLNMWVHKYQVRRILFVGGPIFDLTHAPIFEHTTLDFCKLLNRKILQPAIWQKDKKVKLKKALIKRIIGRPDVPKELTGTPFEVAKQLYQKGDDILNILNAIEIHSRHPQTLAIGRFRDGSSLVCRMDFDSGHLVLARLSDKTLKAVSFAAYKRARVILEKSGPL